MRCHEITCCSSDHHHPASDRCLSTVNSLLPRSLSGKPACLAIGKSTALVFFTREITKKTEAPSELFEWLKKGYSIQALSFTKETTHLLPNNYYSNIYPLSPLKKKHLPPKLPKKKKQSSLKKTSSLPLHVPSPSSPSLEGTLSSFVTWVSMVSKRFRRRTNSSAFKRDQFKRRRRWASV